MQTRLIDELSLVGKKMRTATQLTVLATIWLLFFFTAWGLSLGTPLFELSPAVMSLIFLGVCLLSSVLFCIISRNWFSDVRWLASRVESCYPELDSRLLTSLDQLENTDPKKIGFLQHLVLMQTVAHSSQNRWDLVVSPGKLMFSHMAAISGFVLLLIGSVMIANGKPVTPDPLLPAETADVEKSTGENLPIELVEVEPGNTEVEKGTTLTVLAKFKSKIPEQADLVYEFISGAEQETGQDFHRVPMTASFDDPIYAGQVPSVNKPFTYWVEYDNQSSPRYYATVFQYPELQQLDFELDFPKFTGLPNKIINDARRLSALKGTKVTITARLNKAVSSCQLVAQNLPPIEFEADPAGEPVYTASLVVEQTARYELKLLDDANRANKLPPEVQINALDNKPPKIKLTAPSRDVEVSPLEELETAAKVSDDFGIERVGISYSLAGQKPTEVVLSEKLPGKKDHKVSHQLAFEGMNVQPKQMVSYFYWVEDLVADGKSRRVMSDMFFAEVREFEQIFRQGQSQNAQQQRQQQRQQQQQQGQQQQQLGELRQLQKEIINATWKLIRRETDEEPSEQFDQDVGVIQDSQQSASELVNRAIQQQNSPEAAALGTQIKTMMNQVVLTLQSARNGNSVGPLLDAVSKEQAVYQMILRLGTNESQVRRQQQQQQGQQGQQGQQQNRSQQQLQQLELSNDRNRYEQENQAQLRQEQQQSEARQALNRLKELARRQEDINKQLEQLQTALEEAKSEEEKEEIERRLKRLREQQEELLRDLDELKDETEKNQDSELMQKASEDLDKARENVRRSAEALKENQVSQAAAAGNRAQKQFEDLKEEFRKNNANQFAEEMKEMSDKANELKTKQDEIADRLKQMDEKPQKSLRENDDRKQVAEDLIDQRKKYDSILEDIKDVVRRAEDSEPLLSQELYDTFRDTTKSTTRDSIDTTENLLSRGFITEARKIEENANQGIEKLNERIQNAAENIIGDETDSLRRAEQTLRKLSEQINSEIAQSNPDADRPNSGEQQPGKGNSGKKSDDPKGSKESQKSSKPGQGKSAEKGQGKPKDGKGQTGKKQGGKNPQGKGEPNKAGKSQGGKGSPKKDGKSSEGKDGNPKSGQGGQPGGKGNPQGDSKSQPKSSGQDQPKSGKQGQGKQGQGKQGQGKQQGKGKQGQGGQNPGQSAADPQGGKGGKQNAQRRPGNPGTGQNRNPIDGFEQLFGPSNGGAPRPISGDEYRQFSNELRNIEELLDDPKLRARAAEIREKAKEIRVELKRHSKTPNWDVVQEFIADPLENLRAEVARKLLLKENKEALVPIDRDPVPTIFEDQVQEYYKELSEVEK